MFSEKSGSYLEHDKEWWRLVVSVIHHAMTTCGRIEIKVHSFLLSALDGGGKFQAPVPLPPNRYSFDRRVGESQNKSGRGKKGNNFS
jgi:hypothetical protein